MTQAIDRFGRIINYLRISLTDKCNLRCVYCMAEDMVFRPNPELLQDDELLMLVRVFADLGFGKYRLTGGEPTVRPRVVEIVREMANTPGVRDISMTTNGVLLDRLAEPLARAGLRPPDLQPQHARRRMVRQVGHELGGSPLHPPALRQRVRPPHPAPRLPRLRLASRHPRQPLPRTLPSWRQTP